MCGMQNDVNIITFYKKDSKSISNSCIYNVYILLLTDYIIILFG